MSEKIEHLEPAAGAAAIATSAVATSAAATAGVATAAIADPGKLRFLLVSLAVVVLDQWTKWLV